MTKGFGLACLLLSGILASILGATTSSAGELAGTSWQLLNITSMDDRVDVPDTPSDYTLDFNPDGTAQIVADCNRGSGAWRSESAGRLQFGPIASTRALCPPGSLSQRYLAQFEWVRSYVMERGHLFLATMADGSIIEFEPAGGAPLAAMVLGEKIHTTDPAEMQEAILSRLFEQYAVQHGIEATDVEISTFIGELKRGMQDDGLTAEDTLTPDEAAQIETMRRDMARSLIRQWKINRQLYGEYGGRVIYQQFGPEPLDAYQRFLRERQRAGSFSIVEQSFEPAFWRYFTDDTLHTFFEPGSEASAFKKPPWLRE
ncbi:MAG: META domain-containing protein [Halieaceae bacterium]|nr:META domain-containing protein [Halieaceae bacterium]